MRRVGRVCYWVWVSDGTFYVLIMFSTECSWQTKESLWALQLPEAPRHNGSVCDTSFSDLITFFLVLVRYNADNTSTLLQMKHGGKNTQSHRHIKKMAAAVDNSCLAALWELVCFLQCFVSIGTLHNYPGRGGGGGGGGKKEKNLPSVNTLHPSIHTLSFIQ